MQINIDEELCWPDLPERFDLALRDAVSFVLDRFNVAGIVAAGTILRGTSDATSDLDIYVINRESFRQRIQRFSRNVPTEILVNPPWTVRSYLSREHADGRPISANTQSVGCGNDQLLVQEQRAFHPEDKGAPLPSSITERSTGEGRIAILHRTS